MLRQQFVRLGVKRGDFVAVTSGIKEGETVVSTGVFKLRNGQSAVEQTQAGSDFQKAPIERLEWLNLLGIPGWYLNSRLLRRRSVPGMQVRLYDRLAPLLARAESVFRLPIGMSLLAVARAT